MEKIWCGVFSDLDEKDVHKFRPDQLDEMIRYMDTCNVLIGHNILSYDIPTIFKILGYKFRGKLVDTLVCSRMLNPKRILPPHALDRSAGPHSLYSWGVRCGIDKPEYDAWKEGYTEEMMHRCAEDVRINIRTYKMLMKEAEESGGKWRDAFLLSFKLFENLHEQEQFGWFMNQEKMHSNIAELERQMAEIDEQVIPQLPLIIEVKELKEKGEYKHVKKPFLKSGEYSESVLKHYVDPDIVGVVGPFSRLDIRRTDINSRNETVAFLLSAGWEPLEYNYNDSGERTSPKLSKDDPFDGVEGEVGKLVAKRVQCRHRKSLIEGLFTLIRPDGRIGSAVNGIAVTGRMQHRNIVNIPQAKSFFGKECRSMFGCPPGKVLVSTDSDGNQVRQLCARMNDDAYTDAVVNGQKEDGTDIHSVNMRAAQLPDRDVAKTFFYGFLFGAGDAKVGEIVKGSSERGKQLKQKFIGGLPALKRLLDELTEQWRSTAKKKYNAKFNRMEYYDGYIIGLDGRSIKVPLEHQILVYLLQSDEAIQMSAAYNWCIAKLKRKYRYGEQVNAICFYHDEFTFECDEDIAEDVKKISEEAIAWAGRFYNISCPHVGQGKIGHSWAEVH